MALASRCSCLTKLFSKLSIDSASHVGRANYGTKLRIYNYSRHPQDPKPKHPWWHVHKNRVLHDDMITAENKRFIDEMVGADSEKIGALNETVTYEDSPLKDANPNHGVWTPKTVRCGLIGKKIGDYPLWLTNGRRINATMIQIIENSVVKYTPPEEYDPPRKYHKWIKYRLGCLLVGSENVDPTLITKEYHGLFKKHGVLPKKHLCRFHISPEAALPPGMPLTVNHFRVGDVVDIRGKTIWHGFQGVIRKWHFKGMPATHGHTKTHRRGGCIGGGGEKGRVWPGTKIPGFMGNSWESIRGMTVLRIDPEHNVMWVQGLSIPGETNSRVYIYDTRLPLRRHKTSPPFPTHVQVPDQELVQTALEKLHDFGAPTITYPE